MNTTDRIAVVGAGPGGLAAAYRLQAAGADVVVIERQEWVGGRTRTDRVDGFAVDSGAQLFGSMYTRLLALVEEVGLGPDLVRSPGRDALWRDGRAHEVVYGSVASMLASGGLGMRTKMRLGTTYLPFLTRHGSALELQRPEGAAAAGLDDESIAAWGERTMGTEFVEALVYPQLAAYFGALPEETSAGLYHILARHGVDVTVHALRGGMGGLCEQLAKRVRERGGEVRLGSEVRAVEPTGSGVRVAGAGWEESFTGAVIALPAPSAVGVLKGVPEVVRAWLESVRYHPALSVGLLLDHPVGARYFGLSMMRSESRAVAAVCVEENKGAGLVPQGRGLLVALARPDVVPSLIDAEPRDVVEALMPDLERAFPGVGSSITRARIYRWPDGNPVFYPGYLRHLEQFRDRIADQQGRVALAGDYLYAPSVEGAVLAGEAAARHLISRLRSDPRSPGAI